MKRNTRLLLSSLLLVLLLFITVSTSLLLHKTDSKSTLTTYVGDAAMIEDYSLTLSTYLSSYGDTLTTTYDLGRSLSETADYTDHLYEATNLLQDVRDGVDDHSVLIEYDPFSALLESSVLKEPGTYNYSDYVDTLPFNICYDSWNTSTISFSGIELYAADDFTFDYDGNSGISNLSEQNAPSITIATTPTIEVNGSYYFSIKGLYSYYTNSDETTPVDLDEINYTIHSGIYRIDSNSYTLVYDYTLTNENKEQVLGLFALNDTYLGLIITKDDHVLLQYYNTSTNQVEKEVTLDQFTTTEEYSSDLKNTYSIQYNTSSNTLAIIHTYEKTSLSNEELDKFITSYDEGLITDSEYANTITEHNDFYIYTLDDTLDATYQTMFSDDLLGTYDQAETYTELYGYSNYDILYANGNVLLSKCHTCYDPYVYLIKDNTLLYCGSIETNAMEDYAYYRDEYSTGLYSDAIDIEKDRIYLMDSYDSTCFYRFYSSATLSIK